MVADYLCVSIPAELQEFKKAIDILPQNEEQVTDVKQDFGVRLEKDAEGNLTCAAYYAQSGELLKKIYYKGSSVDSIELFRNNRLYSTERYENSCIRKKLIHNNDGQILSSINYEYNRHGKIAVIRKISDKTRYQIEYGYDELMRVNSRVVKINNEIIADQHYRYDILDRIVEYKDKNQSIMVEKINTNNELVSYNITDRIGNVIFIRNKYMCSEYIGTEIDLNGHKTTIKDRSYVDNVMLKKPITNEDDLDFIISNLTSSSNINKEEMCTTRRISNTDIMDCIINDNKIVNKPEPIIIGNKKKLALLPISIRKQLLLNPELDVEQFITN